MSERRTLRLFVKGNADLADMTLSHADGGTKLLRGVAELIAEAHPDVAIEAKYETSSGFGELRSQLESGSSSLIQWKPDVVILSLVDDIHDLARRGAPEEAQRAVRTDLEAVIAAIKEKVGAHILVANASTIDPSDDRFSYYGIADDPLSLRAQRLDLMLVLVSHGTGVSVIDADRLVAELGAAGHVTAPFVYDSEACVKIAAETVRILEDYGFFDERPLLAQVGAKGASA